VAHTSWKEEEESREDGRERPKRFFFLLLFFLVFTREKKITLGEPLLETNNNGALGEKRAASR
jgi:hypothetical protein